MRDRRDTSKVSIDVLHSRFDHGIIILDVLDTRISGIRDKYFSELGGIETRDSVAPHRDGVVWDGYPLIEHDSVKMLVELELYLRESAIDRVDKRGYLLKVSLS